MGSGSYGFACLHSNVLFLNLLEKKCFLGSPNLKFLLDRSFVLRYDFEYVRQGS